MPKRDLLVKVAEGAAVLVVMILLGFIIGSGLSAFFDNLDNLRNALAVKLRCPRWSAFPFGR